MLHHLLTILLFFTFSVAVAQEEETQEDDTKRPSWSAGLPERTKAADLNKPDFKPDNDIEIDMSDFGLQETTEIEMDLPIGETISVKAEKPTAEEMAAELANEELNAEDDFDANELLTEEAAVENEDTVPAAVAEPVIEEQVVQEPAVIQPPAEEVTDAATMTNTPPPVDEATTQAVADTVADANDAAGAEESITEPQAEVSLADSADTDTASNEIDQSIASIDPPVMTGNLDPVAEAAETVTYQWEILQQAPVKYPVRAAMENQEGWVDVEVTIDPSGRVVSVSPVKYSTRGRIFGKPAVQSVNEWIFKPPSTLGITENQTRIYKIEFEL
ncbi:energy transducer TonB [Marinicella meishanensis]|uniref:energy transducer TonB n=1 Tax=Marinicella meishanensis TaxID=2873263 RepID=UPI001CBCDA93|nr:energy transducer TonB [Marinicella sp. NBU2979]